MYSQEVCDRFWSKVNKDGPVPAHMPHLGKCWMWFGGRSAGGYGSVTIGGVPRGVHRVSWEMTRSAPVPDGMSVLHHCDNRACVKSEADDTGPSHLFLGTQLDNRRDCMAKGRVAKGDTHGSRTHPERVACGERNGMRTRPESILRGKAHWSHVRPELRVRGDRNGESVFTAEIVLEMRRRRAAGATYPELVKLFGGTKAAVRFAVTGRTWGWLKDGKALVDAGRTEEILGL